MADHCTSSCAIVAEAVSGSQMIKIDGYSRTKEVLENFKFMTSIPFSVGGHNWVINFYPNGCHKDTDSISVFLVLDCSAAKNVKAKFRISLLDHDGTPVPSYCRQTKMCTFSGKGSDWGFNKFIEKKDLEESEHLRDDCFTIRCHVTVMKEIRSETQRASAEKKRRQFVVVPPSDLHQHLGDLLKNMDGADVTFEVSGERFSAHRYVLAARSSVFKAELLGAMKEKALNPIKIADIEGDVFKSLLHFIYTDSLPEMTQEGSNGGEARGELVMAQHLLVAADRYNIERLKLICEEKLCKQVDSNMVATSLVLAEQHNCHGLKGSLL